MKTKNPNKSSGRGKSSTNYKSDARDVTSEDVEHRTTSGGNRRTSRSEEGTGKRGGKAGRGGSRMRSQAQVGPNSPELYAASPDMLKAAASFPFAYPTGVAFNLFDSFNGSRVKNTRFGDGDNGDTDSTIPGLMTFFFEPTVGVSNEGSSAVNLCARSLYSFVRHVNSGHTNYDSPDLMLYILAMDSVYMWHYVGQKIYGMLSNFTFANRYYPASIINAMGFNFSDFQANLPSLYFMLNHYADKLGAFVVPDGMKYMRRHANLVSGLFVDNPTAHTQTYQFVPSTLYTYEEKVEMTPGYLKRLDTGLYSGRYNSDAPLTFKDWVRVMDTMINKIVVSEDLAIMSGDILKAYGDRIVKVPHISADFKILPSYEPSYLNQIHNMSICSQFYSTDITQDTNGNILQTCKWNYEPAAHNRVLDIPMDSPDPGTIMDATRLMVIPTQYGGELSSVGSEVVTNAVATYAPISEEADLEWMEVHTDYLYLVKSGDSTVDTETIFNALSEIAITSQFAWKPLAYHFNGAEGVVSGKYLEFMGITGDLSNVVVFSAEDKRKLDLCAIQEELTLPV